MKIYFLFIVLFYRTGIVRSSLLGDKTLVIGLFSITDQTNSSGEEFTEHEQEQLMTYSAAWFKDYDYYFIKYNVGNSTLNLSRIVIDLLTNQQYVETESKESKIAAFVVRLTEKLLNRLQMFLQGSQIPIFSLSSEVNFKKASYNVYYLYLYWMRGYDDLLDMTENAYGQVIILKERHPKAKNHEEFRKEFKDLQQRLKKWHIPYRLYKYHQLDIDEKWLQKRDNLTDQLETNITRMLDSSRCICNRRLLTIANDNDLSVAIFPAIFPSIIHRFDAGIGIRRFYPYEGLEYKEKEDEGQILVGNSIHSIFTVIHINYLKEFALTPKDSRLYSLRETFYPRNSKSRTYQPRTNCTCIGNSTSYLLECPPGQMNKYEKLQDNSTDETYGYLCQKCPENQYKQNTSNQRSCTNCKSGSRVNTEQTECIKIEQKRIIKYVKFHNKSTISLMFFVSLGIVLCISFAAIFIKHRDTPIVTTSRFRTTLIHLAVFFIIFCAVPIAYIGKPNPFHCIARPSIFAILYNLNISILLSKSNKMLSAVSAKVKITKVEMRRERIGEIFFVVMNLVIGALIIAIVWFSIPLKVHEDEIIKGDTTKIYLQCRTDIHLYVSIAFTMVLKLLCFIQAFRCRNLPNILNEAWNIVYVSFIAMFLCAILLVIRISTKTNKLEKEQTTMNWIVVLNLVLLLILYGWRSYWIVFEPHKNTRQHFRSEMLKLMKEKAERVGRKNAKVFYNK